MKIKENLSKWLKGGLLYLLCLLPVMQMSCKEDFGGYYVLPEGLEGPIYQQLSTDTAFSEFVKAIDKLPQFQQAINSSGLYTAFAPTNHAVRTYLKQKYSKRSFDEFNMDNASDALIVQQFVDAHFILDMYFEYNFNKLIEDEGTFNDQFRFFTRHKDPIFDYYDKNVKLTRKVQPDNKMLFVFTNKMLTKYNMVSDYQDLYGGPAGAFNVEGSQVVAGKKDIPAINGVIHAIDKVLEPRQSMQRLLENENPTYLSLQDKFIFLRYSGDITQAGKIDSVFNWTVTYGVNLLNESNFRTVFCPPKDAFKEFIDTKVLPGFNYYMDSIPPAIQAYLSYGYVTDFMQENASGIYWPSYLKSGVRTMWGDTLKPVIKETKLASNGLVYILEDLNLPSAFKTVAKGPMLNSRYRWFLDIMMSGGSYFENLVYLSDKYKKFTFIVPQNLALRNIDGYDITRERNTSGSILTEYSYRRGGRRLTTRQMDSLTNYMIIPNRMILPDEFASMQNSWIETRVGTFMQIEDGKIEGNIPLIDYELTENGIIYYLNGAEAPMMPRANLASVIKVSFPNFYKIIKARLLEDEGKDEAIRDTDINSLEDLLKMNSESVSVFIPTDVALETYKTDNGLGEYDQDKKWGDVVKYMITRTRVYSDGSFKQDEAALNPDPNDPTKFVSLYKSVVYHHDITGVDRYAPLTVNNNGVNMTISGNGVTANVVPILYKNRMLRDIETSNGVIHPVDNVLPPPVQVIPDGN